MRSRALAAALAAAVVLLASVGIAGPSVALPPPFPTAATTGPPEGTVLTPGSGTVCGSVDGRLVDGDLELVCDSTVTNTRVTGRIVTNGHTLRGEHLDVGPDTCPAKPTSEQQLVKGNVVLRWTHLHNSPGQDPVALVDRTVIRDSLIDRTCFYAGDHLDGAQLYDPGAATTVVLRHNTIDARPANRPGELGNAAVFLADRPGRGTTVLVQGNLLEGGNYTLSAYDALAGSGVVYDVRNNTFDTSTSTYGPCSSNSSPYDGTSGFRFLNNRDETGVLMTCN